MVDNLVSLWSESLGRQPGRFQLFVTLGLCLNFLLVACGSAQSTQILAKIRTLVLMVLERKDLKVVLKR
ncbi:unnamed protein product [Bursaphelenchus okinawaensis]|uniref:Uncharacterized protein n=1 Tax=Bursaphelenchus okinawaensis TaxID=465554 RepID=A0A811LLC0_9BILA|nr:unnamed protein product [Bursaphelenchus okinawaensis]CAG9125607.1 unnamed protein product [Bursaphelenchus okinawaensis]